MFGSLVDLIYPPICPSCSEGRAEKLFCASCWELLSLPDPAERCRHCFERLEKEICSKCSLDPERCFPRARLFDPSLPASILRSKRGEMTQAIAGLALLLWHRLGWELPDYIVPIPGDTKIAKDFARLMQRPLLPLLKRIHQGFLQPDLIVAKDIQEGLNLLLFDVDSPAEWLKLADGKMAECFPRKAALLSIF
ncbi:MAG: hypothetical protein JSS32_09730 [Verrucomicrobia bacterium]|nr:hypothetical protein [Verrucomicrobiota bacterium]